MILSDDQARKKITNPSYEHLIRSAKAQESALRVFTESLSVEELRTEVYWKELQYVLASRTEKKYNRITEFMRFPLPVIDITESILNDYFKMFEGKNRFFNINADRNIDTLKEWSNEYNIPNWIEQNALVVYKNKPVSVVVVDRDRSGRPYLINVDSDRLVDAQITTNAGHIGYVVFIHSEEKDPLDESKVYTNYAVYDDERYRVYQTNNKNEVTDLIVDMPHKVGYCPAKMFVKTPSNSKNPFKRKVAFTKSISKLSDWTYFDIFQNYTDHYAPFPVTEAVKKKCSNPKCMDGKVAEEEILDRSTDERVTVYNNCQVCNGGEDKGSLVGPGTHIAIQLQSNKDKEDGSGKFKMHFPETDKMEYIPNKLDKIETSIKYKTVGVNNMVSKEAVNELQVKGSFASMDVILVRNKEDLDDLYKWIVITVGRLFYGNSNITVDANFGTEFYLVSIEELQEKLKKAKEIGLPKSEQILIYSQIIDTQYKGNEKKIAREKMLLKLDPFPLYSENEVIEMGQKGVLDTEEVSFKINFYKFIDRFEDENIVITEFGTNLNMRDRIKKISETLKQYNNEYIESKQLRSGGQGIGVDRERVKQES